MEEPKCFGTYQEGQFAPAPDVCAYSCAVREACKRTWTSWTAGAPRNKYKDKRIKGAIGGLVVDVDTVRHMAGANFVPAVKIAELLRVNVMWVEAAIRGHPGMSKGSKARWADRKAEVKAKAPWGKS